MGKAAEQTKRGDRGIEVDARDPRRALYKIDSAEETDISSSQPLCCEVRCHAAAQRWRSPAAESRSGTQQSGGGRQSGAAPCSVLRGCGGMSPGPLAQELCAYGQSRGVM